MDYFKLTSPCGLDCFNCEMYQENITVQQLKTISALTGKPPEIIPCKGCREQGGCSFLTGCATLACIKSKQVDFCFQCGDFPCNKLIPCADGADRYPHNLKIFNLTLIHKIGLKSWAESKSRLIRKLYFDGNFMVGTGPTGSDK